MENVQEDFAAESLKVRENFVFGKGCFSPEALAEDEEREAAENERLHKMDETSKENQMSLDVPRSALMFTNTEGKVGNTLEMVGYSGGVILDHFYWGNLAINLEGMSISKDKIPILENHDTDRKVGFAERDQIEINGALRVIGGTILDTESGREFKKLSREGYPYQSSLYAKPTSIEKIPGGEEIIINGLTQKGPLTIWERSELREISVCTLGWDQNTSATAMSKDIHSLSVEIKGDFDPDEVEAEKLFRLSMSINPEVEDDTSAEDEKLADDLFRASTGQVV